MRLFAPCCALEIMKTAQRIFFFIPIYLFFLVSAAHSQAPAKPSSPNQPAVTPAAVWNPSTEILAAIRVKCGEGDPAPIENCFLTEMKSAGASPEAVAFSKSLASTGVLYLRSFRQVARVDVAYIQYAFRANELD